MALTATVTSQQTAQFNITALDGSTRVFITTGLAEIDLDLAAQAPQFFSQKDTVKMLLEPVLAPGQFRKAVGVVSLATISIGGGVGSPLGTTWAIDTIETTLDDESGKVELRFDVRAETNGGRTGIVSVAFQVTTLAAI